MTLLTVIIVCNDTSSYLDDLLSSLNNQSNNDFNILIVSNKKFDFKSSIPLKLLITKEVSPSKKRNIALDICNTKYVCFLDDDSYCPENYIEKSIKYFGKYNFFGGPGILPINSTLTQKIIYYTQSTFASFSNYRYFKNNKIFKVNELHTVNFNLNLNFLGDIRFDNDFWPGEDTKFFFDILKKNEIYYIGNHYVFHYPRNSFYKYLRQVNRFGFYRIKLLNLDNINKNIILFCPMILTLYFVLVPFFNIYAVPIFFYIPIILYLIFIIICAYQAYKKSKKIFYFITTLVTVPLTHFSYGIGSMMAILIKKYPKLFFR